MPTFRDFSQARIAQGITIDALHESYRQAARMFGREPGELEQIGTTVFAAMLLNAMEMRPRSCWTRTSIVDGRLDLEVCVPFGGGGAARLSDYDRGNVQAILDDPERHSHFGAHLIRMIARADYQQRAVLARIYPDHVEAFEGWECGKETRGRGDAETRGVGDGEMGRKAP